MMLKLIMKILFVNVDIFHEIHSMVMMIFVLLHHIIYVRGSYRACICTTNACNFNYSRMYSTNKSLSRSKIPIFNNTIIELTNRVKCYRPYENYKQQIYSNLTPLCSLMMIQCKNYIFESWCFMCD